MLYFAYGSALSSVRMTELDLDLKEIRPGVLDGYRLAFNRSAGEAGKANIIPARGCTVEGLIYVIEPEALTVLDGEEGFPERSEKISVSVFSCGEMLNCLTHVGKGVVGGLLPGRKHLESMIQGAKFLSPDYRAFLEGWPVAEDNCPGLKGVIFDWGNTLMQDFPQYPGPMADWPRVVAIPGVVETLTALKNKYVLSVATNAGASDAVLVRKALARVDLDKFFPYIFTSRELGSEKPNPAFFLGALRKMGLMPGQCVMVGDNLEKDILAARDVGLEAILYAPQGHEYPRTITRISDLPGLLAREGESDV